MRIGRQRAGEQFIEPAANARIDLPLVNHAGEKCDLLGSVLAASGRQQRAFIPAEQGLDRPEHRAFTRVPAQLVVGFLRFVHDKIHRRKKEGPPPGGPS